jgi:hypothetical protein
VTGREVILESGGDERTADAIEAAGYVCVPKVATQKMIAAAYWQAVGEKVDEIWEEMIAASEAP